MPARLTCIAIVSIVAVTGFRSPVAFAADGAGQLPLAGLPPGPYEQELDADLARHDYNTLWTALMSGKSDEQILRASSWTNRKFLAGSTMFVAYAYSTIAWRLAEAISTTHDANEARTRQSSAIAAVYAVAAAESDRIKCEDASAPAGHLQKLLQNYRPIWRYLATLPTDLRDRIVDTALAIERKTAPTRANDDFLCRGGITEMAGARSDQMREVPGSPNHPGKNYEIPANPSYQPKFLPRAAWQPKQEQIRSDLRIALIKSIEDAKPPNRPAPSSTAQIDKALLNPGVLDWVVRNVGKKADAAGSNNGQASQPPSAPAPATPWTYDSERVIARYDEAIRLNPQDREAFLYRGAAYLYKRDYDRAIADYDAALRLDPGYSRAFEARGGAYVQKGDYDRAIENYDEAIRLNPRSSLAFYGRGQVYQIRGERERAIADYRQALSLDPAMKKLVEPALAKLDAKP